jgi:ring-1,2-phenylacetyl-CoA epoxidase subunit PaaC
VNAAAPGATAGDASAHFDYLLQLADTSLVLGQRLGETVGHAPALEEELGLANIALDLIGQARLLLTYAGELEGRGRDEDQLAMLRTPDEFRNLVLAEQPNGDFACTIVRQVLIDAWQLELYEALQASSDPRLRAIAAKSLKETAYHFQYSSHWLVRLGDGTDESRARARQALEQLWPYTREMFDEQAPDRALAEGGIAPSPASLEAGWSARIGGVLREATLSMPAPVPYRWHGRRGVHSEHLGYLLAEMQVLQRTYPGAQW